MQRYDLEEKETRFAGEYNIDHVMVEDNEGRYVLYADAQAEIETLKAEIVRMKELTWCAYCGHEILIDDEAATKISKHITEDCPKHPIRIALAEIAALREKLRERDREIADQDKMRATVIKELATVSQQLAEAREEIAARPRNPQPDKGV